MAAVVGRFVWWRAGSGRIAILPDGQKDFARWDPYTTYKMYLSVGTNQFPPQIDLVIQLAGGT